MSRPAPLDNEALAHRICQDGEVDGQRLAAGSFVAIADGRVLGIGRSFDEADAHLVAAALPPGDGMICEVAPLQTDVIRREPGQCR
jgi:hypothetical protein